MEAPDTVYETLSPLQVTADATPPPPQTSPSSELEPYVVFRNQISLSAFQCPSPESAAPDYFSLDVNEAEDKVASVLATPGLPHEVAETSTPAAERTLEGNWFRANCRFKSPMLQLHKEILDFCDFLSPTREEQQSRNAAIESVFDVVKYIWPNAEVEVFGSFKTGLYLPSSDIDVVILGSNVKTPQMGLQALSRALSQRGIAKKIQVIAKARVPIIKFVEKKSGVAFDISFDVHNGPKAAEFIQVYTGGIGSYALLSMLIAMLRAHQDRQASPEHNLGVLLVNFFDMYGCRLNTVDVGVSCNGGGIFFSKSNKGFTVDGRPSLIAIEDPQAPDNDIGKNSFNYYQARSAFAMAFTTLTNAKVITRLGPNRSILGAIIRPDAVLLERKGGSTGKVTFNNLFPGAGEPLQQLHGDQQEIYCNWPLNDEDEEPLPRGNGIPPDSDVKSSGKRRKSSKENKSAKKVKRHGTPGADRYENGSLKEPSTKKQNWRR
ncbi:Terminal nucleotidyltransferase 4B [Sesamum alatum]|uniref:polynucleotide adenylyltransferase n=1 Tax=Sesamum alatum TaxID=300844 RepID=A0AAE2CYZ1_9LAMI|nr:Terminal nucleotidyltransferase 4B [Sesamum alatum]